MGHPIPLEPCGLDQVSAIQYPTLGLEGGKWCEQRRVVLKKPDYYFSSLRTALKDSPQGPTSNRQPPTAANSQPPTAATRQPPPTANRPRLK